MKCINKFLLIITASIILTGCGYKYEIPYAADSNISSFSMDNFETSSDKVDAFSKKLCIVDSDINADSITSNASTAALLFDLSDHDTIYAKNAHEKVYPASLTKIMTAIVALKNADPDMVLTATSNVYIEEWGVQSMDLREGDQMTLEQALNIMLIYSANDVANMVAEGVGGSIDNFVAMMNEEALKLGATNTHFVNANGLTNEEHYTTPYDLYLMMNEAVQFDLFNNIINKSEYETTYFNVAGNEKTIKVQSTNFYLTGSKVAPGGITVIGGKTGTTNAAGHCLIIVSRDDHSNNYISVVMKSENRDDMYSIMNSLLAQIE